MFIYNKRLRDRRRECPQDHADFARLINAKAEKFKGKVTTYDIEKSRRGLHAHHAGQPSTSPAFWELVKALGARRVRVYSRAPAP